jgi:hypothetical protein
MKLSLPFVALASAPLGLSAKPGKQPHRFLGTPRSPASLPFVARSAKNGRLHAIPPQVCAPYASKLPHPDFTRIPFVSVHCTSLSKRGDASHSPPSHRSWPEAEPHAKVCIPIPVHEYHIPPLPNIFKLSRCIPKSRPNAFSDTLKQPDAVKNSKGATAALRPRIRHVLHPAIPFRSTQLPAQEAAPRRQPARAGPVSVPA